MNLFIFLKSIDEKILGKIDKSYSAYHAMCIIFGYYGYELDNFVGNSETSIYTPDLHAVFDAGA